MSSYNKKKINTLLEIYKEYTQSKIAKIYEENLSNAN